MSCRIARYINGRLFWDFSFDKANNLLFAQNYRQNVKRFDNQEDMRGFQSWLVDNADYSEDSLFAPDYVLAAGDGNRYLTVAEGRGKFLLESSRPHVHSQGGYTNQAAGPYN